MSKRFEDQTDQRAAWRAIQLWQVLVGCTDHQRILTYGQVAEMMGYKDARPLIPILYHIMFYCQENGLPPLTVLVVRKDGGAPGDGLEIDNGKYPTLDAARMAVFGEDWYSIIPPTADEFHQAYEAAKAAGKH